MKEASLTPFYGLAKPQREYKYNGRRRCQEKITSKLFTKLEKNTIKKTKLLTVSLQFVM